MYLLVNLTEWHVFWNYEYFWICIVIIFFSFLIFRNSRIFPIAKLNQNSNSSGAELALFPADPTTNAHPLTHLGKFVSVPSK